MKKKWIVVCLLTLCLLTACGNGGKNNAGNSKQDSLETEDSTMDTESTKDTIDGTVDAENIMDSFVEQPLDLTDYSLAYELATDDQPFFIWSQATKSEYGYYYFKGTNLVFFDKNAQREVPVCNKADCLHDGSGCNAYFGGMDYNFSKSSLQYYDGFVYIVGYDNGGYTSLIRIAADGSSREKYMELYKADVSSPEGEGQMHWRAPEFCIHRDYVYYIDSKESIPKIRRMRFGGTETEVVFETGGIRPTVYRMLGYGDYIFFQVANYLDEHYTEIEGGIFACNIHTGEIQMVKKDAISSYLVVNNAIYYKYNGNTEFRRFDFVTSEDKLILDNIGFDAEMSVDNQYIYQFSESGMLSVYDHDGNSVCTVSQSVEDCYFGDGTYIIGENYDYDNNIFLSCVIEVSDFADGKAEWTYLD